MEFLPQGSPACVENTEDDAMRIQLFESPHWRLTALVVVSVLIFSFWYASPAESAAGDEVLVYVLPVEGTMEPGLAAFVRRSIESAEEQGADVLILRIRTLGGLLDTALDIRDMLLDTTLETVAFVKGRAWSAGVLVTIACDHVVMAPGSSIGAAEPRPTDEKIISAWSAELQETARHRGRDPELVAAMVQKEIEIEGVVGSGELLTLTATQAEELGMIDAVAGSERDALTALGISPSRMVVMEPTTLDLFVRYVTNPYVAPFLLAAAFLGMLLEAVSPGFGVPGLLGVISLVAYFLGHVAAGYAGLSIVLLFAFGFGLLVAEIFIPEFGILGVGGIVAMLASIYLASPNPVAATWSIVIAFVTVVITVIVLLRMGHRFPIWKHLLLAYEETTDRGYLAQGDLRDLVGQRGVAVTMLRPAGTAEFGDVRADVVTEGGFIAAGTPVQVVKVEGRRVIVRAAKIE